MIKGLIWEANIILFDIYTPSIRAPKYIKQILRDIKGQTDRSTIIVRDFKTPLALMDRRSRQKINKATEVLNDMIDQLKLTAIYRTLHPKNQNTHYFQAYMEYSLG